MSDTAQYILLLAVSVVLTFLVGRLLVTAGEPYLQDVFRDNAVTRSVNLLLSVLFHLITLGVLAIISVFDLGSLEGEPIQRFVLRLGMVLLVLGIAYGISMLVLIRVRERRKADVISEHVQERLAERGVDARPQGMQPVTPEPPYRQAPPQPPYQQTPEPPPYRPVTPEPPTAR
jgi:hypothetical protein